MNMLGDNDTKKIIWQTRCTHNSTEEVIIDFENILSKQTELGVL